MTAKYPSNIRFRASRSRMLHISLPFQSRGNDPDAVDAYLSVRPAFPRFNASFPPTCVCENAR